VQEAKQPCAGGAELARARHFSETFILKLLKIKQHSDDDQAAARRLAHPASLRGV
jgi:hypothetical protein